MLFNSYYFVLYFLPVVLLAYYGVHAIGFKTGNKVWHRSALWVLAIASFVFYAYDNLYYLALLAGSIVINWIIAYVMNRYGVGKPVLVAGILIECGKSKEYKGVSVFADLNPME